MRAAHGLAGDGNRPDRTQDAHRRRSRCLHRPHRVFRNVESTAIFQRAFRRKDSRRNPRDHDGWTIGEVTLAGEGKDSDEMKISFQNEYSFARLNGRLMAIVPDLIIVLDRETGEAITAESLRYGQRVKVLGVAAPAVMRSEAALEFIGPRAFSIDEDFVPLEDLATTPFT